MAVQNGTWEGAGTVGAPADALSVAALINTGAVGLQVASGSSVAHLNPGESAVLAVAAGASVIASVPPQAGSQGAISLDYSIGALTDPPEPASDEPAADEPAEEE